MFDGFWHETIKEHSRPLECATSKLGLLMRLRPALLLAVLLDAVGCASSTAEGLAYISGWQTPQTGERSIADEKSVNVALVSLGEDIDAFGYVLRNARASQLRNAIIVRLDIVDSISGKTMGMAVRVDRGDKVDEGIFLH